MGGKLVKGLGKTFEDVMIFCENESLTESRKMRGQHGCSSKSEQATQRPDSDTEDVSHILRSEEPRDSPEGLSASGGEGECVREA